MRRLFLLVLLATFALSWSQVEWLEDGIPVRQGVNIEWFRSAISLEDGGCVFTWSDTRLGDRDVFAQRVDSDGNMLWGVEAAMVNGEINRQEDIVVINGNDDETIYAWVEFRHEDAGDIYAQKLDGNGNIMWASEGVPLCLVEDIQISINIVSDASGGAYIIWLDDRNPGGSDIYGTHILSDGSIAEGWDTDGNAIIAMDGNQTGHTFWEDGAGGAIVVWTDTRNASNQDLYMQRISWDGTLLWDTNGTLLCGAPQIQESAKISPDGTGNFIVTWWDKRNENDGDIYANRIDLDGNILWANDLVIYQGFGIQRNPRITESSDTGAIITWEDGRYVSEFKDIFVQKVTTNGTLSWATAGEVVCVEVNDQLNPRLVSDDSGGCWIIWDDGRNDGHPNEEIYIQHFNSDGDIQLADNGQIICDAFGEQFSPLIKKDGNGQMYLSWGDNRDGSTGLYVQLIDDDGNDLLIDNGQLIYYGLCGDALSAQIFCDGDKSLLLWEDTRFATIATQIYMQVMDENGDFDLIEDGIAITDTTGSDQVNFDAVLNDAGAAVSWVELRGLTNTVYAQLVDMEGNHHWGDQGLQLNTHESEQSGVKVSEDNGYYYFGWSDRFGSWPDPIVSQVCAQKVDVNGNKLWGDEGISAGNPDLQEDVLMDVVGRYFIWKLDDWPDAQIYASYLTEDGDTSPGWPENGLLICDAPPYSQQNAQGVITDEGLLVVWEDLRNSTPEYANNDLYGQLITESGEFLWETDGAPLVTMANDQVEFKLKYYQDYIYLIWGDFRNGTDYDIYMQKFDLDGVEQWEEGGVAVVAKPLDQANAEFTFYNDHIVVYWDDVDGEAGMDLFMQMFNLEGELVGGYPQNGENICRAIKNQSAPAAVVDDDGYSYVIWSDFRSSGKTDIYNIYAQKQKNYPDTIAVDDELDDQVMINMNNYPNPFRKGTVLSFSLQSEQLIDANVTIYNTKGQKVRALPIENNRVYWDGKDDYGRLTATGVYMYRLNSKYFKSQPAKMIRMK
ncbi:MAG: T9SS type A sorting domain-containing protein [Candidatus Cloacimonetes bacterium]|nr:T9SS type A sorting domain-containing protein [Candidatus Cloacimonadota bacterium]